MNRSVWQSRESRNRPKHMWSINFCPGSKDIQQGEKCISKTDAGATKYSLGKKSKHKRFLHTIHTKSNQKDHKPKDKT